MGGPIVFIPDFANLPACYTWPVDGWCWGRWYSWRIRYGWGGRVATATRLKLTILQRYLYRLTVTTVALFSH